jgi:hypothetical protein|tara:strand:+ start:1001 stop:1849 length:849 start_codon:yes stop_codon:yes gene_type:complete
MAIDNNFFKTLVKTLKFIDKPARVACLGYPDLMCSEDLLEKEVGLDNLELKFKVEYPDIHSKLRKKLIEEGTKNLYTTESFFKKFNLTIDVFDIFSHTGKEKILDLNEPLPLKYKNKYKGVVDVGTLEHCFNVGQAFKNMCDMLEVGGIVFTAAPSYKKNHGFWNFCSTAFTDGFLQNGFEIIDIVGIKPKELGFNKPNPEDRKVNYYYKDMRQEAALAEIDDNVIMCVAKKVKNINFKWPLQMKYAKNYNNQLYQTLKDKLKGKVYDRKKIKREEKARKSL